MDTEHISLSVVDILSDEIPDTRPLSEEEATAAEAIARGLFKHKPATNKEA